MWPFNRCKHKWKIEVSIVEPLFFGGNKNYYIEYCDKCGERRAFDTDNFHRAVQKCDINKVEAIYLLAKSKYKCPEFTTQRYYLVRGR